MEEKVFFSHGNVSVSNARFIVNGQTYAMNGVTSVKQSVNYPSRLGPVILGIIGLLPMLSGHAPGIVWGMVLLALTVIWWTKQKPLWIVVLNSSSGETQALTNENRAFIDGVIEALNQSIIHRG
jgi:uncharacterized membrane protein